MPSAKSEARNLPTTILKRYQSPAVLIYSQWSQAFDKAHKFTFRYDCFIMGPKFPQGWCELFYLQLHRTLIASFKSATFSEDHFLKDCSFISVTAWRQWLFYKLSSLCDTRCEYLGCCCQKNHWVLPKKKMLNKKYGWRHCLYHPLSVICQTPLHHPVSRSSHRRGKIWLMLRVNQSNRTSSCLFQSYFRAVDSSNCLKFLDRIQDWAVTMFSPVLSTMLKSLAHRRNLFSLSFL